MKKLQKLYLSTGLAGASLASNYPCQAEEYARQLEAKSAKAEMDVVCDSSDRYRNEPLFWRHHTVRRFDSGVVIPDHSARRIAAAQAKRERKAAKRNTHQ